VFARMAKDPADHVICLLNMTPQVHHDYKVGVLKKRLYKEIFTTDDGNFGGSNMHNAEAKEPYDEQFSEAPYHITVSVPPFGGIILKPQ